MKTDNDIKTKTLSIGDKPCSTFHVQFNKARIRSSAAKVDATSIAKRPCFLCKENRPPEQESIDWRGKYELLENPFPIFPQHLTIPTYEHIPQTIKGRFADMLALAKDLPAYTLFYNGPQCGASAPDHMHFQAGSRRFMPIEEEWQDRIGEHLAVVGQARLHLMSADPRNTLLMIAEDEHDAVSLFNLILQALPKPMVNVLCYFENQQWFTFIFTRTKHRPACYFATGDEQMLVSPASVDIGGVFITAREQDFERIDSTLLEGIIREVCWQEPEIETFKNNIHGRT
ncbi:MAG: DUF4922 domain-containing protein [Bacteroidaceae bacterium]|nr:DUF4922 domain-containing protein [Bacteroidaceae bacterium]